MQPGFPSLLSCTGFAGVRVSGFRSCCGAGAARRLAIGGCRYAQLRMQLGPTNASTATWTQRLLPRVGPRVSSLPCWRSFLGSSCQMPTPARARDATTRRLIDATARSPKQSAWLGKVTGLTRADPAMPPPTSSIPIARGNTLGVALMRPVMRASAPSPSGPATRQRARPGPMSV